MSLSITASPPAITVTDTDGHTVLDTGSQKLFYATNRLSGSFSVPTRTTPVNLSATYAIGSCDADANFIRGVMKVTGYAGTEGGGGVPVNIWVNIGGTYVHTQTADYLQSLTFRFASAGVVEAFERSWADTIQNSVGQTFAMYGYTVSYELFVGGFI